MKRFATQFIFVVPFMLFVAACDETASTTTDVTNDVVELDQGDVYDIGINNDTGTPEDVSVGDNLNTDQGGLDTTAEDSTTTDTAFDLGPAPCTDGEKKCSDDAYDVLVCSGGDFVVETKCMLDHGQLCEDTACVDPWRYGSPVWPTCDDDPLATPKTLAQKAAYYDELSTRLNLHPLLKFVTHVDLPQVEIECVGDQVGPCYGPAVDPAIATWEDVVEWSTGANDGLWNALYLTSQAFRYAVTKSDDALATIRTLIEGEQMRMRITGVPGIFTRMYNRPDVPGAECPTDVNLFIPNVKKDNDRMVKIGDDGCVQTYDPTVTAFVSSDHCGLDEFAGWCWLDNVSQDEYAGHMLALAAVWKLVDDEPIRTAVKDMVTQFGVHLMENDLYFVDWDGRRTEHGKLHALSFADSPGFLSTMSMAYILMAAEISERQDLRDYYDLCLLQRGGGYCAGWPYDYEDPYDQYLDQMLLYLGPEACLSNYNNFSMVFSSLQILLWFENDPEIREKVQSTFANHFMDEGDQPRALIKQKNPWFNFGYAAFKALGPNSDGHIIDEVGDGICSLREFPETKIPVAQDNESKYEPYCESRLENWLSEYMVPVPQRCISTFEWWGDPYDRDVCSASPWQVKQPCDFLLPYWMGRYFGFISEDM